MKLTGEGLRGDADLFEWWDAEHKRMVAAMTIDNRDEVEAEGRDAALLRVARQVGALQAEVDALGLRLSHVQRILDTSVARLMLLEQRMAEPQVIVE